LFCFFFQAEDGIRDFHVTGVQTCALPISCRRPERTRNPVSTDTASAPSTSLSPARTRLALLALALGGFGIGSTEFVAMGLLPQRSEERRVGKECRAGRSQTQPSAEHAMRR